MICNFSYPHNHLSKDSDDPYFQHNNRNWHNAQFWELCILNMFGRISPPQRSYSILWYPPRLNSFCNSVWSWGSTQFLVIWEQIPDPWKRSYIRKRSKRSIKRGLSIIEQGFSLLAMCGPIWVSFCHNLTESVCTAKIKFSRFGILMSRKVPRMFLYFYPIISRPSKKNFYVPGQIWYYFTIGSSWVSLYKVDLYYNRW